MKKISIILAMAALALGFSSCKQEDEPKYKAPTTFEVNTPALQDQAFRTSGDMTDPATFNLFCSQPDYGYAAICKYSALVSLDPNLPLEDWVEIQATNPSQAAMAIKTYDLGVAINTILGVEEEEDFHYYDTEFKVYLRAVCEIEEVEGSRIVSSNYVTYNKVYINYAVKRPGWIFICGDVENIDSKVACGWAAPAAANYDLYKDNFALYEPEDMIGEKLYFGSFTLNPKPDATDPATADPGNPDQCSQFRFFTELLGWTDTASLGSHPDDFYCLPITADWLSGYEGNIVAKGLGNWGVFITEPQPVTVVVDVKDLKVYVMEGVHAVEFNGRIPSFN